MSILGIDIGGTKTALVLGTSSGETSHRVEFPTRSDRGFEPWLREVVAHAGELRRTSPSHPVACVSVAVGGPMDSARGVLLSPPHLDGWPHALPLVEQLAHALGGLHVHMLHDAQAGAFAEYHFASAGVRNLAFLTFATGFGMGIVLNGRLLDVPGEVGHWRVAEDGPEMFGKRGSLEGLASGNGIAAQTTASGHFPAGTDVGALARAARAGNDHALRILDAVAVQVGRQCARLIDLFGLDAIALGTIAVHAGDLLLDRIRQVARDEALPHLVERCRIDAAGLGPRLGDVACLCAAIKAGHRDPGPGVLVPGVPGPSVASQIGRLIGLAERVHGDSTLLRQIDDAARLVGDTLASGGKILTCGNGGSATDAAHLAEELSGRYRGNRRALAGINLAADGAALTCIANDFGFEEIFARQIEALGRPGDLLVTFTTSGNSENINRALRRARQLGVTTLCLTGKGGGEALNLADHSILIPDQDSARIQELHTFILHAICEACEAIMN